MEHPFSAIILKGLSFLLTFLLCDQAHSLTITSITGASRVQTTVNNTTGTTGTTNTTTNNGINSARIYGGAYRSEDANCGTATATSFCDTCDGLTTPQACNTTAVHKDLALQITFRSDLLTDTNLTYYPIVYIMNTANQVLTSTNNTGPILGGPNNANTFITVSVTWEQICSNWESTNLTLETGKNQSDCRFNANRQLGVGFSTTSSTSLSNLVDTSEILELVVQGNSEGAGTVNQNYCRTTSGTDPIPSIGGACNFTAFPGDKKVFIENVIVPTSFPNSLGSAQVNAIRIYYAQSTNFSAVTLASDSADLEVSSNTNSTVATMESNTIEGLENNTSYVFKMATVDEANNVSNFSGFLTADITNSNTCFESTEIPNFCHQATPESVIGLLEDEFDCFIATASYGSPFEQHVRDLRKFRSQYLRHSYMGRKLIEFYYQNSPPIAHWIKRNPSVKPIVRWLLWPFWFFAKLSLEYGPAIFLGLFGFLLAYLLFRLSPSGVRKL